MYRAIESDLKKWINQAPAKPLIIRGARQVGKSYLVQEILSKNFENLVTINFERQPEYKNIFEDTLDPRKIISDISTLSNSQIKPGKTLLFFDEIQACPKAITSLRYFNEEMPEQHVASAGSLLEFAIGEESAAPVGRVTYLYLGPLTYEEFLINSGAKELLNKIKSHDFDQPFSSALHKKAIDYLTDYLATGGMPAAVSEYLKNNDLTLVQRIQSDLLISYQDDIPKYATRKKELEYIKLVLSKLPGVIGNQFKYTQISRELRSIYIQQGIDALAKAGLVTQVFKANKPPLSVSKNLNRYKIFFLDVGLMQRASGMDLASWRLEKSNLVHTGSIAEQYVAQQLTSLTHTEKRELFYWERDKKGSSAEIDFLYEAKGKAYPIEVKSGSEGKMKSLFVYMEEHKENHEGYRFSLHNFAKNMKIRTIPLYAFQEWCRRISG